MKYTIALDKKIIWHNTSNFISQIFLCYGNPSHSLAFGFIFSLIVIIMVCVRTYDGGEGFFIAKNELLLVEIAELLLTVLVSERSILFFTKSFIKMVVVIGSVVSRDRQTLFRNRFEFVHEWMSELGTIYVHICTVRTRIMNNVQQRKNLFSRVVVVVFVGEMTNTKQQTLFVFPLIWNGGEWYSLL